MPLSFLAAWMCWHKTDLQGSCGGLHKVPQFLFPVGRALPGQLLKLMQPALSCTLQPCEIAPALRAESTCDYYACTQI